MTIKVSLEISQQVLEDIIVTALEGGSNYWYYLDQRGIDAAFDACVKANVPTVGLSLSEVIARSALLAGACIPVRDAEDEDEVIGHLTLSLITSNIQKMIDDGYMHIMQHLQDDFDADSADAVFQYMTLGEIVYG